MNYDQLLERAYESVEVNEDTTSTRFEIPKVQGHHLGSRTVVSNFLFIATRIRRDPIHFMKFLAKELASQGEINNDRLLLSRKLSSKDVNEKVEKYVNHFVLCSNCKKPDTELIDEQGKSFMKCLACGTKREIHKI